MGKGNLGALGSAVASLLLGRVPKVNVPFLAPRAKKTAETARFGPLMGKTESTPATAPKFRLFSSDKLNRYDSWNSKILIAPTVI